MQQSAWTDSRMDEFAKRVDANFAHIDAQFKRIDARFEQVDAQFERVDRNFERVDRDIRDLRAEMNQRFLAMDTKFDTKFDALQTTMYRVGGGLIVAMLAALATNALIAG